MNTSERTDILRVAIDRALATNPRLTIYDLIGPGKGATTLLGLLPELQVYNFSDLAIQNSFRCLRREYGVINEGDDYYNGDGDTYMEDMEYQPAMRQQMTRPPATPYSRNRVLFPASPYRDGASPYRGGASPYHSGASTYRGGASTYRSGETSPSLSSRNFNHYGSRLIPASSSTLSNISGTEEDFGSLSLSPKYNQNDSNILQAITTTCEKGAAKRIFDSSTMDYDLSNLVKENNETIDRNFQAGMKSTNHSKYCSRKENSKNSITTHEAMKTIKEAVVQYQEETNDLLLGMKQRDNDVDATLRKKRELLDRITADFEARKAEIEREMKQIHEDQIKYKEQTTQVQEQKEAVSIEVSAYLVWLQATSDLRDECNDVKYAKEPNPSLADYQKALEKRGALQVLWKMGNGTLNDFRMMIEQPRPQVQTQVPKFVFATNNSATDTTTNGIAPFHIGVNKK